MLRPAHPARSWLPLCILLILTGPVAAGIDDSGPSIRVWTDVNYLGSDRAEKLDLFIPPAPTGQTRVPAVVLIHGGGFGGGSKDSPGNVANSLRLARSGIAVANIDYLLARPGRPSWPQVLFDCKNAVRFVRLHADRLGIDPERISVMGGSAGGQLALLTGLTAGHEELTDDTLYPKIKDNVHRVVNLFGGTNFATRRKTDRDGNPTDEPAYATAYGLLGTPTPDRAPETWALASPVTHARADAPPVLTIHGLKDRAVDHHQAKELAAALDRVGAANALILVPNLGHGFGTKPIPDELFAEIVRFLIN